MKVLILIVALSFSYNAFAFEKADSSLSLSEALSASNKDYNGHKKELLDEENDRIDRWGDDRKTMAVSIDSGIAVEARDYKAIPVEGSIKEELIPQELKAEKEENQNIIHKVSMND